MIRACLFVSVLVAACGEDSPLPREEEHTEPTPRIHPLVRAPYELPAADRIVAFGDVHGDIAATRRVLRMAGIIDESDRWTGDASVVVQVGDQLDRGDDEPEILDLFARLSEQARASGGWFIPLLGNHETMNAQLDFRYVTEDGFRDFSRARDERRASGRTRAFAPGGPYAIRLSDQPMILKVGRNIFVHGGVLPRYAQRGIAPLNDEVRAWLRGERSPPDFFDDPENPLWYRGYSQDTDSARCADLEATLTELDADRMFVAHTVQPEGINGACDSRVYRLDVGLGAAYGGPAQAVEIRSSAVRVLGM